jgi:hypothetical protein
VRIAVFRYTPAAPHVLVGDVDTLPKELDEKRADAEGYFYIFAEVEEGRVGRGVRQ